MSHLIKLVLFFSFTSFISGQAIAQWVKTGGDLLARATCFAVNNNTIFAGTGLGVFRSTDLAETWEFLGTGPLSSIGSLIIKDDNIFAGKISGRGSVYRSSDNGENWVEVAIGIDDYFMVYSFAIMDSVLFAAASSQGVFHSTNAGASWDGGWNGSKFTNVISLVSAGNHLFAGTVLSGIIRSSDGGQNWSNSSNGLKDSLIINVLVTNGSYLFAGSDKSGIYRSSDNGDSWNEVNTGLSDLYIQAILVSTDGIMLAGTSKGGLFLSTDNGDNWREVNEGLPSKIINALTECNKKLFVASGSQQILSQRPISEFISTDVKQIDNTLKYSLENYPNPFGVSTTIQYTLPSQQHARLVLTNVLGEQISVLADKMHDKGIHSLTYQIDNVPNGMYYLLLETEYGIDTRTINVLK